MATRETTTLALTPIAQNPSAGRWRTEAMRSHQSPRLIWFTRGQGRITVAGLTRGYGPNNLIYIPPGTMYGYDCGAMVAGLMLTLPLAVAPDWPDEPVHLRLKDVVAQKECAALFDALERELTSGREGAQRAALHHAGLIAIFFQRNIGGAADHPRGREAAARIVAAYTDLVERNYRKPLGVADYARRLGVTPTHLTRCCRQTCGRTAHQLLRDRVLFEARQMLRDTDRLVQEVARELGYRSAAYFTRAFQAATGLTPTRFRRDGAAPLV